MELKCYITKIAEYRNFEEWEREIIRKKDELFNKKELDEIFEGVYYSPDSYSVSLYKDLVSFLNQREDKVSGLKEKYKYEFSDKPFGIKVMDKSEELFYLKADQLGFSNDHKIYAKYLKEYSNKDEALNKGETSTKEDALKNYARWLYDSRSIGGCFLWPMEAKKDEKGNVKWENSPYNRNRGRGRAEDRADMALADVKRYYCGTENWLFDLDENKKKLRGNLKKWLDHFGGGEEGFKRYIEFFCFEPFMDMKQLNPKNMRGQNGETIKKFEDEKKKISDESAEIIGNALNNLTHWIKIRSLAMILIMEGISNDEMLEILDERKRKK